MFGNVTVVNPSERLLCVLGPKQDRRAQRTVIGMFAVGLASMVSSSVMILPGPYLSFMVWPLLNTLTCLLAYVCAMTFEPGIVPPKPAPAPGEEKKDDTVVNRSERFTVVVADDQSSASLGVKQGSGVGRSQADKSHKVSQTDKSQEVSQADKSPEVSQTDKSQEVSQTDKSQEVSQADQSHKVSQTDTSEGGSPTDKSHKLFEANAGSPSTGLVQPPVVEATRSNQTTLASVQGRGEETPVRWCDVCNMFQEAWVRHCRLCNVCVRELDHHCGFIGACIGARNKVFFAMVLSYLRSIVYTCFAAFVVTVVVSASSDEQLKLVFWKVNMGLFGFLYVSNSIYYALAYTGHLMKVPVIREYTVYMYGDPLSKYRPYNLVVTDVKRVPSAWCCGAWSIPESLLLSEPDSDKETVHVSDTMLV